MRNWLIFLCLCIAGSLMLVSAMPAAHAPDGHQHAAIHAMHDTSHCDEPAPPAVNGATVCDSGQHACCMSLAAVGTGGALAITASPDRSVQPFVCTLQLAARANKVYKPPRQFLHS